jgi:hypothetical protein
MTKSAGWGCQDSAKFCDSSKRNWPCWRVSAQRWLLAFERCKHVSRIVEERVTEAIFRTIAKKNPEAVEQAAQPALELAEKWERVLSVEPGSEAALKLEKQPGKSLAEWKIQAETLAGFLRSAANIALSLTK